GVASSAPYWHDGRAKTLDEAIRLHGGEADAIRKRYERLTPMERQAVLAFLRSLVAPTASVARKDRRPERSGPSDYECLSNAVAQAASPSRRGGAGGRL